MASSGYSRDSLRGEAERVGVGDLAVLQLAAAAGAVDDDGVLYGERRATRGAQRVQQRHEPAAPVGRVEHDHYLGPGSRQPGAHGVRAEPGEQDGVDGADPVAGVDGGEGLDHVGHVDRDDITLGHPERREGTGQPADLVGQLGVGHGADVAGLTLPDDRGPARRSRVLGPAVHAVVRDVHPAAAEKGEIAELPGSYGVPRPHPALLLRDPGPVRVGAVVMPLPGGAQQLGLGGRMPLLTQRLQRRGQQLAQIVCHRHPPRKCRWSAWPEGQTGLM